MNDKHRERFDRSLDRAFSRSTELRAGLHRNRRQTQLHLSNFHASVCELQRIVERRLAVADWLVARSRARLVQDDCLESSAADAPQPS